MLFLEAACILINRNISITAGLRRTPGKTINRRSIMGIIWSKLFLYISGFLPVLCRESYDLPMVASCLLGIIGANTAYVILEDILTKKVPITDLDIKNIHRYKMWCSLIISVIFLSAIKLPCVIFFLPVMLYDCIRYRLKVPMVSAGIVYVYSFADIFTGISQAAGTASSIGTAFSMGTASSTGTSPSIFTPVAVAILVALAVHLEHGDRENLQLKEELKVLHDNQTEKDMIQKEHDRMLMENQNNMIYMATLKERNRIAREIHDNVGHTLTRSILQLGAIKAINKEPVLKKPLDDLHGSLGDAMTNIRKSVHDLHDESIDLESSIRQLTEGISAIDIHVDYDMSNTIPKDIKYSFIAITKEAVSNAVKHSNGDTLDILLREHPGFYQLIVKDNGTDIKINNTGIGLANITDRVNAMKGSLKISTDKGFKLLITVAK